MPFLVKEEPSNYSFDAFVKDGGTTWTGVKNPLAQKHLRSITKGDLVFYYHTGDEKQIVGIARAAVDAYPDPADASGKDGAAQYNAAAFAVLKPGGIYLVSDHEGAAGTGATQTNTLHRIESAAVIREIEAAGFMLDARSEVLRHPADDHTGKVFDSGIRGKTDQFVLRFVKPRALR